MSIESSLEMEIKDRQMNITHKPVQYNTHAIDPEKVQTPKRYPYTTFMRRTPLKQP